MKLFPTYDGENNKYDLVKFLKSNELTYSFNQNPERFISRSITPTNLSSFLTCPHCHFQKRKLGIKSETESSKISQSIHYILDYLYRRPERFKFSTQVLEYINFRDGNLLEDLKTDEENTNYDILSFLGDIEDDETRDKIIRGVMIGFGTFKKMRMTEVRKRDSISVNLTSKRNNGQITIYNKPDLTGRHPTTTIKTLRTYDNFLMDYKLNFDPQKETNSLQTTIYYLSHILSNRNIHHYYILDLTSANLYKLKETNISTFIELLNEYIVLRNINYRRKNPFHKHIQNPNEETDIIQNNFLDDLQINSSSGEDFGSKIYQRMKILEEKLKSETIWEKTENPMSEEDLEKVMKKYQNSYTL